MKQLTLLCFLVLSIAAKAQKELVFSKADSSKVITIKEKDLVRLAYTGYFNQLQEAEGFVSALNDSSITLSPRKKFLQKAKPAQTIYLRDITGFRKYSKFRPAGEIIYGVVAIGIAGTVTAIIASADVPTALSFLSAAGTAMVTGFVGKLIMSNKIKNRMADGWTMRLSMQ